MKKGDERRAQILETAERIFYEKGYEATSVQDILDAMNLSKGGFYHHFESKIALLTEICELRSDEAIGRASEAVAECEGAIDKLNALFSKGGLLHGENADFVGLFLRIAYRGEGVVLRERMKAATVAGASPLMAEIVARGVQEKVFYTRHPDEIGDILLQLFADLMDGIAYILATRPDEIAEALSKLEAYRSSVELLLNAPYGSIELFRIDRMAEIGRVSRVEPQRDPAERPQ